MAGYGQYCPVAKAAEILDQRWMLLVVRELIAGSTRFNDIHRGVPRMSRTLLSKRMKQLVAMGVVERRDRADGPAYTLTDAGEELRPVIDVLGRWGVRWLDSLNDEDLDPAFLLWDIRRGIDLASLPDGQTVVALTFRDLEPELRDWWLLLTPTEVDVCYDDPGLDVDVAITTPIRTFIQLWRGDLAWTDALRRGGMQLVGPEQLRRRLPDWFTLSHFSSVPR